MISLLQEAALLKFRQDLHHPTREQDDRQIWIVDVQYYVAVCDVTSLHVKMAQNLKFCDTTQRAYRSAAKFEFSMCCITSPVCNVTWKDRTRRKMSKPRHYTQVSNAQRQRNDVILVDFWFAFSVCDQCNEYRLPRSAERQVLALYPSDFLKWTISQCHFANRQ